jgi:hypothetical protein
MTRTSAPARALAERRWRAEGGCVELALGAGGWRRPSAERLVAPSAAPCAVWFCGLWLWLWLRLRHCGCGCGCCGLRLDIAIQCHH